MFRRQGKTYTKFHHVHLEAEQCFELAAALSPLYGSLMREFMQNTWRTGQEGIPPELVSAQCMKTRLCVARLSEMLDENTAQRRNPPPHRVDVIEVLPEKPGERSANLPQGVIYNPAPALAPVYQEGSTGAKRKGRPPNKGTNPPRNRVREIYEAAKREGITLTHAELCARLDVQKVKLPPNAKWARCPNWPDAYARFKRSVQRWLSGALANSKEICYAKSGRVTRN
jgi:hypothetical protein